MSDGHSGGDAVRVDDHIWDDSFNGEGKILLTICHTACSFLTVPGSELISDLRDPDTSDSHLCKFVACCVLRNDHQVHNSSLGSSGTQRCVFELSSCLHGGPFLVVRRSKDLSNKDFFVFDGLSRRNDAISIQFEDRILEDLDFFAVWLADLAH